MGRPRPGAAPSGPRRAVRALADRRSRSPSGLERPRRGPTAKAAPRRLPARSRSWRAPRTVYFAIRVVSFSKRKAGLAVKRGYRQKTLQPGARDLGAKPAKRREPGISVRVHRWLRGRFVGL